MSAKNSYKILVPLATLAIAGAVAVGSGATWTSESSVSASVTAGNLTLGSTESGKTLTVTGLNPGDSQSGTVTLTNSGTVDSTLELVETPGTSNFTTDDLLVDVLVDGATVLAAPVDFEALGTVPLGNLPKSGSVDVTFVVSLDQNAGDEDQGATAGAAIKFIATQSGSGSSTVATWN